MKTLFPAQANAAEFFLNHLRAGRHTLDTSEVGTGKTVVASFIARSLSKKFYRNDLRRDIKRVAVICPKAVIPMWDRELIEMGVEPEFVLNYEKIRTGKTPFMSKRGKKIMTWNLEEPTLILIDEVHKCKSPWTQNAQLLISLVEQAKAGGHLIHAMSATAAEDPTEMRALGFMLGLHDLNKRPNHWHGWMELNGCAQDRWGQWRLLSRKRLADVHDKIYGRHGQGSRLYIEDFPDSFKENRVFVEPVAFKDSAKIIKAYDELGITPAIIESFVENGESLPESDHVLVRLLQARQLAESFKVGDMVDMTTDLVSEGKSVVLFVNFRDTAEALCEQLDCDCVVGGQSAEHRQQAIDDFQADRTRVLVVNIAAGGTGLSLHDVNGKHARVSLISPSFNAKDHLQALGRIHRNGAKSHALQKILVAADSVEETVMTAIKNKLNNLTALHG
tara:strand:- start:581 stop:1921 length:1341 start_codon:yes stop_codon:yes gene_type:complete